MLSVNLLNFGSIKQSQGIKRQNNSYQSVPNFSPKYNKTLNADVVSFSGKKLAENRLFIEAEIKDNLKEAGLSSKFGDKSIKAIADAVTPRNERFLYDIMSLGTANLSRIGAPANELASWRNGVISLLNYVDDENTDLRDFNEKIHNFKDMKHIVKGFGFRSSVLSDHINDIPMKGIVDILKTDLLIRESRYDYNSFPDSYNFATRFFNHHLNKVNADLRANKLKELDAEGINDEAKSFMKKNFSNLLVLNMIFDESTCNELMYNRGKYIESVYMPRLRMLNQEDLQFLRRFQVNGITYKDDKGGNLKKYNFSLDDKIYVLNLLAANRLIKNSGHEGLNIDDYIIYEQKDNKEGNFKLDFQRIKMDLMDKSLKHIGVDPEIVDKYMEDFREAYAQDPNLRNYRNRFWDINYAHLLPLKATEGTLLRDIIVHGTSSPQAYRRFLYKEGPVAEINAKNREAFERAGIDYDRWIEPMVIPITKQFKHIQNPDKTKTFKVEAWRRNPQESLFDGNYTTCCTGIDKDQGDSFPIYMTNTATTTLEVRTMDKNKVLAMSRLLLAKIDGKPALVVENIEVNNKMAKHYLYNDEAKQEFREMIFDYARKFAQDINKNDEELPVYFCGYYYKVKDIQKGLKPVETHEDVELIGEFPDGVWLNSYGRRYDRAKAAFADDGDEFALKLHNITKKAERVVDPNQVDTTDSDYNFNDTCDFGY